MPVPASPRDPPPHDAFRGKIALVVGASRGIGAATALAFAARGATTVLAARDVGALRELERRIRDASGEAIALPVDVADAGSVGALGRELATRFGRLDVAFNNAGTGFPPTDLAAIPTDDFDRVVGVHLRGTFLAMAQELPLMLLAGGGAIVNMSSTAGSSAYRGGAPYVAAKHAIVGLTEAAALDYAERNVRVNVVAPGPIDTDRMKGLPESYRAQARQAVPMRRLGEAEEVAEAVLWLCSPASGFVTGATLAIDGGRSAGWS